MRPSNPGLAFITLVALAARADEIILEDKGHRVRGGFSAEVGTAVQYGGVAIHGELRFGSQLTQLFGLFGTVGAGFSVGLVQGGQFDLGAIAELTLADHFFTGAGFVLSYGTTSMALQTPVSSSLQDASAGVRPALDLRLGFSTGASRPPSFNRGGLSLGVHAMLVLHPDMTRTTTQLTQLGAIRAVFTPQPAQFIFTPMVTLGFDFR